LLPQPMDASALLRGKEPLLKLQLTHCSDGGSVLAATMPHILVGELQVKLLAAVLQRYIHCVSVALVTAVTCRQCTCCLQ
jgi:hypothetical protein